ncbi:MAG: CBS domain-containing protein [Nitrospirota bacterium]
MTRRVDFMLGGEDFLKMTAAHVMQTEVYYFSEDAAIVDIIAAITMGGFGSVPITKAGDIVVGLVSEYDILNAIFSGKNLETLSAKDIMTKGAISVLETTSVNEIIATLQSKHLIRVPVVDENEVLIGIVARIDILMGYLRSVESPPKMAFNLL